MCDDALEAIDRMIDEDSRRRKAEMDAKDDEIERLRDIIRWSLGESPESYPDFPLRKDGEPLFYWRKTLRKLFGGDDD